MDRDLEARKMKLVDKYDVRHRSGIFMWSLLKDHIDQDLRFMWQGSLQAAIIKVWKMMEESMPIDPMKRHAPRGPGNSW